VWGWNDNGQCAKPEDLSQVEIRTNSGSKSALIPLEDFVSFNKSAEPCIKVKQVVATGDRTMVIVQNGNASPQVALAT